MTRRQRSANQKNLMYASLAGAVILALVSALASETKGHIPEWLQIPWLPGFSVAGFLFGVHGDNVFAYLITSYVTNVVVHILILYFVLRLITRARTGGSGS